MKRGQKGQHTGRQEEDEDQVVEDLKNSAADSGTHFVSTRLVQAESETVE